MLDPGATRSVINRKIVDDLNLHVKNKPMRVITIDSIKDGDRDVANFMISDLKGIHSFPVAEALIGDILTLENDIPPTKRDIEGFSHLDGVEFDELPNKEIGMLLSVEFAWSWMGGECRRGSPREPVAYYTCYGWTMMGCNGSSTSDVISHLRIDADNLEFSKDVKVFEGNKEDTSANEYKCSSVKYDMELACSRVGLPWDCLVGYDPDSHIF